MKIFFKIILIFVQIQCIYSQNIDRNKEKDTSYIAIKNVYYHKDSINFLYDPLDVGFKQIIVNDNAFLVTDTTYYDFLIYDIRKIQNGYFISAHTKIQEMPVRVQIISMDEKLFYKNKIKKGKHYRMKLTRYFETPLKRGIEHMPTYNVMVGRKSVAVLSTGYFAYLFVTQNLQGLEYLDSASITHIETSSKKLKNDLHDFLYQIIPSLSFKEDTALLVNYFDTSQVKKSLKCYKVSFISTWTSDYNSPYPPKKIEKYPWQNYGIKINRFHSLFWGAIDKFYLSLIPINRGNREYDFDNFAVKVLDVHNGLYTIRVRWKIHSHKPLTFQAVFVVKRYDKTFKVVGFNNGDLF